MSWELIGKSLGVYGGLIGKSLGVSWELIGNSLGVSGDALVCHLVCLGNS